ncbi:MAG TPA: EF-hand domain-containing protein [Sumerlaeia bacterium]|nr:EF-hand domain-containing protein [Sumerlaeia bacterium]
MGSRKNRWRLIAGASVLALAVAGGALAQPDSEPRARERRGQDRPEGVRERAGSPLAPALRQADKDRDGAISRKEFAKAMNQVFDRLDRDGNGGLSPRESRALVGGPRPRPEQGGPREGGGQMIQRLDADKDGKVSAGEFRGRPEAFKRIDADADGYVTPTELAAVRRKRARDGFGPGSGLEAGEDRPVRQRIRIRALLERLDADADGKISSEEFRGRQERFQHLDANGDGYVTPEELASVRGARQGARGPRPDRPYSAPGPEDEQGAE